MVGLFLCAFAKRALGCRDVHTSVVKTGLGGLHGNKVRRGVRRYPSAGAPRPLTRARARGQRTGRAIAALRCVARAPLGCGSCWTKRASAFSTATWPRAKQTCRSETRTWPRSCATSSSRRSPPVAVRPARATCRGGGPSGDTHPRVPPPPPPPLNGFGPLDKMSFVRGGSGATFLGYEHAFFFGDLNYRIDTTYSHAVSQLEKGVRGRSMTGGQLAMGSAHRPSPIPVGHTVYCRRSRRWRPATS